MCRGMILKGALLTIVALTANSLWAAPPDVRLDLIDNVAAHATNYYDPITLQAGELARVTLLGDGDTVLDLYLFDQNWNIVDQAACGRDACVVQWIALRTASFYIVVANRGGVYNTYAMSIETRLP